VNVRLSWQEKMKRRARCGGDESIDAGAAMHVRRCGEVVGRREGERDESGR
jgi:hypothetical protein